MSTIQPQGGPSIWKWERETSGVPDLPQSVKDSKVICLRLVTHTMGPPGSTNHWTFFLIISDGPQAELSVHFNFRQGAKNEEDVMVVAMRQYVTSNSSLRTWDFASAEAPTVAKFLGSIRDRKQYAYDLNTGGTGCREWM